MSIDVRNYEYADQDIAAIRPLKDEQGRTLYNVGVQQLTDGRDRYYPLAALTETYPLYAYPGQRFAVRFSRDGGRLVADNGSLILRAPSASTQKLDIFFALAVLGLGPRIFPPLDSVDDRHVSVYLPALAEALGFTPDAHLADLVTRGLLVPTDAKPNQLPDHRNYRLPASNGLLAGVANTAFRLSGGEMVVPYPGRYIPNPVTDTAADAAYAAARMGETVEVNPQDPSILVPVTDASGTALKAAFNALM